MREHFVIESFLKARFHGLGLFVGCDNDEIVPTGMTHKIGCSSDLIHNLTDQHGSKSNDIIAGHKPVNILKGLKVVNPCIEQRPTLFANDPAQLILDQTSRGASRTGIC